MVQLSRFFERRALKKVTIAADKGSKFGSGNWQHSSKSDPATYYSLYRLSFDFAPVSWLLNNYGKNAHRKNFVLKNIRYVLSFLF